MVEASSMKAAVNCEPLKQLIREVPDFPKPGILFYDITTLLKDKTGFATLIDALSEHYVDKKIDLVLGMEARGFYFWTGRSLQAQCRIRSSAQARETSRRDREIRLRPRVWNQHA